MTMVKIDPKTSTQTQSWPQVDRRRAGRAEYVNPELVPLLRGKVAAVPDLDTLYGDPDQLRGARGLGVGVVVSCALWIGLGYLATLLIH